MYLVLLKVRTPFIPAAVLQKREATMEVEKVRRKLERDLELEQGRDYIIDLRSRMHKRIMAFVNNFSCSKFCSIRNLGS